MTSVGRRAVAPAVVGVVLVIAVHGLALYAVSARFALSAAMVGGLILVVAATHLGWLGALRRRLGRRPGDQGPS